MNSDYALTYLYKESYLSTRIIVRHSALAFYITPYKVLTTGRMAKEQIGDSYYLSFAMTLDFGEHLCIGNEPRSSGATCVLFVRNCRCLYHNA